jgi:hypothetical protein
MPNEAIFLEGFDSHLGSRDLFQFEEQSNRDRELEIPLHSIYQNQ